ncbi:MAG: hypothetical protein J7498_02120 [Sphingobium sp.]|nr:hypothetical protein [Sphingobium sp.]
MVILLSFWILVVVCCAYGAAFGGRSGRIGVTIFASGALLTGFATLVDREWRATVYLVFWIDLLCLIGFLFLALRSRHYWPLWFAGLHLVAVLVHLVTIITPHFLPKAYVALQAFWAIPMLVIMVAGIRRDRQAMKESAFLPPCSPL